MELVGREGRPVAPVFLVLAAVGILGKEKSPIILRAKTSVVESNDNYEKDFVQQQLMH